MQKKSTTATADFEGVYIFTNPSFKEYVKIGRAVDQTIEQRLKQLNASTAVPFSFSIYATYRTDNAVNVEKADHKMLDQYKYELRAREKSETGRDRVREFFLMEPEEAIIALQIIAMSHGNEDNVRKYEKAKDQIAEEETAKKIEKRARAAIFSFERKGIKPSTIIEFTKDSSLTAKVLDEKYIEYDGEQYTLTRLAKKFLGKEGVVGEVAGPRYFKLGGVILSNFPDVGD